jgi:hypothetical protein
MYEQSPDHYSEDETTDMRQISYSSRLHFCDLARVDDLREEPHADQ